MKINEAYVSPEKKKQIATALKPVLSKYGIKATLGVRHNSTIVLKVNSGSIDFINNFVNTLVTSEATENAISRYKQVLQHKNMSIHRSWVQDSFSGKAKEAMIAIFKALDTGNHDRSDSQTDYFDVGHYVDVKIGGDKSYVCTGPEEPLTPKTLKALGMSSGEQNDAAPDVKAKPTELENHGASAIAEFYNFKFDSNGVWEWSTEQPELMGNKAKGQEVFRIVSKSPEWKKFKSDGRKTIYMNKTNGGTYIDISNGKEGALVDKMAIATQHIKESNLTEDIDGKTIQELQTKCKGVEQKYGVKIRVIPPNETQGKNTVSINVESGKIDFISDFVATTTVTKVASTDIIDIAKSKEWVTVHNKNFPKQFSGDALKCVSEIMKFGKQFIVAPNQLKVYIGGRMKRYAYLGPKKKITEDAKQLIQNPILKVFDQFGKQYLAQVLDASLNKMIQAAAKRGAKVTVPQIITEIQKDPKGQTAQTLFKAMTLVIKQISSQMQNIVNTSAGSLFESKEKWIIVDKVTGKFVSRSALSNPQQPFIDNVKSAKSFEAYFDALNIMDELKAKNPKLALIAQKI